MKLNWGNYITIFIGLFLTLCTIFIIFSLRQNRDLVTDNYYEDGADFTRQMEINKRSAVYSDSITVTIGETLVVIELPGTISKSTKTIKCNFYRPSDKGYDYIKEFENPGNSLTIERSNLKKGRYILKLTWEMGAEDFLVEKNIFIN